MSKTNDISSTRHHPCTDCKWLVLGSYSHVYGGTPIGCSKPLDEKHKPGSCLEKKETSLKQ